MTEPRTSLKDEQFPEVQKLALTGYDFDHALHLVLKVTDAGKAREFLRELLPAEQPLQEGKLTFTFSERGRERDHAINVGFTYRGLLALGLPETLGLPEVFEKELSAKAKAFLQGAAARAAGRLGDFGASAAERWEDKFRLDNPHVLLTIYAASPERVEEVWKSLHVLPGAQAGLAGWTSQSLQAQHLSGKDDRTVHFGFRDNISRPVIDCSLLAGKKPCHSAGELLLGYANDAKFDLWSKEQTPREVAEFVKNGSFAILRKVEQHEDRFAKHLRTMAERIEAKKMKDLPTGDELIEFLKAKVCGRWPNGSRVLPNETRAPARKTDKKLQEENEFTFIDDDPKGLGCPFGAHIRRTSPRGDPALPSRRRPLFRRGIPYGPRYPGYDDKKERGLVGLFFCASIEDQFEHIVSEWVEKSPMGPPRRGDAKDPLVGQHDGSETTLFHIPLPPAANPSSLSTEVRAERARGGIELDGFDEPFVTTHGTLYAFFPSRSALAALCLDRSPQ
jgi:deferrochelatase/peroxidase EfeB